MHGTPVCRCYCCPDALHYVFGVCLACVWQRSPRATSLTEFGHRCSCCRCRALVDSTELLSHGYCCSGRHGRRFNTQPSPCGGPRIGYRSTLPDFHMQTRRQTAATHPRRESAKKSYGVSKLADLMVGGCVERDQKGGCHAMSYALPRAVV